MNNKLRTNTFFSECRNCTRKYEQWCSYFEAKQTCDYKQYLQKRTEPFVSPLDKLTIHDMTEDQWYNYIRNIACWHGRGCPFSIDKFTTLVRMAFIIKKINNEITLCQ